MYFINSKPITFKNDEDLRSYVDKNKIGIKDKFYFIIEGTKGVFRSLDEYLYEG